MTLSALALQQAVYATLVAHVPLTTLLGGPRVYDEVPQPVSFPYVTFGPSTVRDADTAAAPADEHLFSLTVWSRGRGRSEAYAIVDVLRLALHDRPLPLASHILVNLRHEATETRRLADGETIQAIVRLRAVTEPA